VDAGTSMLDFSGSRSVKVEIPVLYRLPSLRYSVRVVQELRHISLAKGEGGQETTEN
jgi:hypothetical protein